MYARNLPEGDVILLVTGNITMRAIVQENPVRNDETTGTLWLRPADMPADDPAGMFFIEFAWSTATVTVTS